jgi:hypothetical protein
MKIKQYIREGFPYPVAYQNFYDEARFRGLGIVYLADQERWEEAVSGFFKADLPARITAYEYIFRKFTDAGRIDDARALSVRLLETIQETDNEKEYGQQVELIRFYLSCLG